jgi:L-lactate dehydrogenase
MGIAQEIVMIDINTEKALGEALDIRQGLPFCTPSTVFAGSYVDAVDSDIVIITSGMARKPGQTRLDLAQVNVNIMKDIIPQITGYAPNATYIIVSNPVDILTYTFCKCSGLPEEKIIGSGTILDTARLRAKISEHFSINQKNVHAYVLGEHGDSSFIPWSLCNISNVPILDYPKALVSAPDLYKEPNFEVFENYVKKSGGRVIERKGATFYAVSVSVCHICKCLLSGIDTTMTISTMMHGEYGIEDVCLSTLALVGSQGIQSTVLLPLTDEETALMRKSADCLKAIINQVSI